MLLFLLMDSYRTIRIGLFPFRWDASLAPLQADKENAASGTGISGISGDSVRQHAQGHDVAYGQQAHIVHVSMHDD